MNEQYAFRFDQKVTTTDTNAPQQVLGFRSPNARDGRPQPFVLVEYCGAITGAWYYPHELELVPEPTTSQPSYVGQLKDDGEERPMPPEMRRAAEKLAGRH